MSTIDAGMRAVDLIRKQRDGLALEPDEVRWLIESYTAGDVGDDQMAAFAMAVFFRGMSGAGLAALTESMMNSGNVMDLSSVEGRKVDKHSTGGVGDKVSICLAPLVAACGVPVPMISGRGLGHTGGTLDKLTAIPGFDVSQDDEAFLRCVQAHGVCLAGQTATLAPADKKLYALRDVTSTVESVPLIAASILSKKLAEGIDALVLDVKVGSGAFMKTLEDARTLARTLVSVGARMGRDVVALLTSMDQVLGRAVGNANETWEAFEVLRGGGPSDLVDLTVELGAEMLVLGEKADDLADGRTRVRRAIKDGRGLEKMRKLIEAQGGDPKAVDDRKNMPTAAHEHVVTFDKSGHVTGFEVEAIGRAGMLLGAGRARTTDVIDYAVGFEVCVNLGDRVEVGQPFVRIEYNEQARLQQALEGLERAIIISEEAPESTPSLIRERIES